MAEGMNQPGSHWDEHGVPRAKHPPCPICGADEIGSRFGDAWCHCCAWRGPLLALLAHAKERADAENATTVAVAAALAHEDARTAFEWSAENEDRPIRESKRSAMQQAHRDLVVALARVRR